MGYSINKTDVAGLRFLYKTDAAARYILESLAKRRNNWKITTISSLFSIFQLAGFEITRKDIIRTARELEKMNYCEFILGKVAGGRNEQSRIVWKIPPGNVGRIAVSKI
jgi:hypothetical protein